jgi:hypothetical protein
MKRLPAHEAQGAKRHCVEGAEGTCARGDSHRGDSAAAASAGGDSAATASDGDSHRGGSAATASGGSAPPFLRDTVPTGSTAAPMMAQLHCEIMEFTRSLMPTSAQAT